jgi:hypothetical protein
VARALLRAVLALLPTPVEVDPLSETRRVPTLYRSLLLN